MFRIGYGDIVNKIVKEKGVSREEVETKINDKITQLSDLVSKEGAAHIIANQYGVKVFEDVSKRDLKINEVIGGLSSVTLNAKVTNNFGVREFDTGSRKGRVANLMLGDETGVMRLVIWDEKLIALIDEGKVNAGDIIKVKGAYVRENSGLKELHLGNKSELEVNPEGVEVGEVKEKRQSASFNRKKISDLKEGDFVELLGVIVQVFEPRFYEACPQCGKKLEGNTCKQHGQVESKEIPILNVFFDDGSGNLRAVFFRDLVANLFDIDEADVLKMKTDPGSFEDAKNDILGTYLLLSGRVVNNQMFERLELMVRELKYPEPEQVIKDLE